MKQQFTASEIGRMGGMVTSVRKSATSVANGKLGGRPKGLVKGESGPYLPECKFIYTPAGQALEYSALAANPYSGCGHKCAYCYVPKALRMSSREAFDNSAFERTNYLKNLEKDAARYKERGITEQVMLSFTTDPYHPYDTSLTPKVIEKLHEYGMGMCALTKGGSRALRDLHLYDQKRDAFATTLTSLDDDFSMKWERGAAVATDRISTLQRFHEAGIFTWVSMEPTIDIERSLAIIDATHSFVDHYKIGRVNYINITKETDWESYTLRIIDKCQKLGVSHYIKRDLQQYLPEGYYNPLRVQQHH